MCQWRESGGCGDADGVRVHETKGRESVWIEEGVGERACGLVEGADDETGERSNEGWAGRRVTLPYSAPIDRRGRGLGGKGADWFGAREADFEGINEWMGRGDEADGLEIKGWPRNLMEARH